MTLALILHFRWKLLKDEEGSQDWLTGFPTVCTEEFKQKTGNYSTKETLCILRKLVFKAAIICEGTKYCFNYAIQARDHQLDILEKQGDQDSDENEKFDILRSFSIIKIFFKQIKRSKLAAVQQEEQKEAIPQAEIEKLADNLA